MHGRILTLIFCLVFLFAPMLRAEDEETGEFVTKSGKRYTEAKILRSGQSGLLLKHQNGVTLIEYNDIPDEALLVAIQTAVRSIPLHASPDPWMWGVKYTDGYLIETGRRSGYAMAYKVEESRYWIIVYFSEDDARFDAQSLRRTDGITSINIFEKVGFDPEANQDLFIRLFPNWVKSYGAAEEGEYLQFNRNGSPEKGGRPEKPETIHPETIDIIRKMNRSIIAQAESIERQKNSAERRPSTASEPKSKAKEELNADSEGGSPQ